MNYMNHVHDRTDDHPFAAGITAASLGNDAGNRSDIGLYLLLLGWITNNDVFAPLFGHLGRIKADDFLHYLVGINSRCLLESQIRHGYPSLTLTYRSFRRWPSLQTLRFAPE